MSYSIVEPRNKLMIFRRSDIPVSRRILRVRNDSNKHMYLFIFAKNADVSFPVTEQTIWVGPGGTSDSEIRLNGIQVAPIRGKRAILRVSVGFLNEKIDPIDYWKGKLPQIDGVFADIHYFDVRMKMEPEIHVAIAAQNQEPEPAVERGRFSCFCVFWIVVAAIVVVGIIFRSNFEDYFHQIYRWLLGGLGQ